MLTTKKSIMGRAVLLLILVSFFCCKSGETEMNRLADDYCGCFQAANDRFTGENIRVVEEGMVAPGELAKMDPAKWEKFAREFVAMNRIAQRAGVNDCVAKLMDTPGGNKALTNKTSLKELITLIEKRPECRVATIFLKHAYSIPREQ
jgi:hypothetical protein